MADNEFIPSLDQLDKYKVELIAAIEYPPIGKEGQLRLKKMVELLHQAGVKVHIVGQELEAKKKESKKLKETLLTIKNQLHFIE